MDISSLFTPCALSSVIISVLSASPVLANSGQTIEETVVNVTRIKKQTFEMPYSVGVVDSESLNHKLARTLPEALKILPGVMVQKTANGHGSPFIRGFTGYRTLALIDGIRYNNSVYRDGPNEYFGLIDFNTVSRIELLGGPSSAAYGSDAIGGALNIQTARSNYSDKTQNENYWNASQSYRYASAENSHLSRTTLSVGEGGQWGALLGFSYKNFGDVEAANLGKLPTTGYDEKSWDARLDSQLSDHWALTLVHQQLMQDDVWRTHSTIYSKSFAGSDVGSDQRRLKDQKRRFSYVRLTGSDLNDWLDKAAFTVSQQRWDEDGERVRSSGASIQDFFDSEMTGAELQLNSHWQSVQFTYGFDFYRDQVDTGRVDFNFDGSVKAVRIQGPVGDDARYDQWGVYLQADIPVNEQWALSAGTRFSGTRAEVGRFESPETGLPDSYDNRWNALVSSLRVSFQPACETDWNLWAGLSQSFRAPNIADISRFGGSRSNETEVAATNLDPEYFLTGEIGAKARWDNLAFTATAYYTDIRDFITSTPTGRIVDGMTEVSKQNSSSGFIEGVELTADWQLGGGFTASGNITWLRGELDVYPVAGSTIQVTEPMSRIMPMTANLALSWDSQDKTAWARMDLIHAEKADRLNTADKDDLQRIPPGGTPSYTVVDVMAGYQLNKNTDITLGINNLFDEAYRSHGSGSNEPGRGLKFGVRLSL
ncbi:TonB-dependent receptor [Porticoccaceae bacterium LTM1]|nr:TonB-dependent receptor [Porticoccaceae bacterium LTM1]